MFCVNLIIFWKFATESRLFKARWNCSVRYSSKLNNIVRCHKSGQGTEFGMVKCECSLFCDSGCHLRYVLVSYGMN